MRIQRAQKALACVGAVIGAGFASGREIMAFFTQYGAYSWGLIVLATAAMTALCVLVMRRARASGDGGWCGLYAHGKLGWLSKSCLLLLYSVTGGAMLSAAGELAALLLPIPNAYALGLALTAGFGLLLYGGTLRPLMSVSFVLALLLLACSVILLSVEPGGELVLAAQPDGWMLAHAVIRVLAYAGLNVAIALGVICECACNSTRGLCRTSLSFGLTMTALFFVSNALYLRHPELTNAALPLVRLLSGLGRMGYLLGALTLYLAVFTTWLAILRTLRSLLTPFSLPKAAKTALPVLPSLFFSFFGFQAIVEKTYAPVGLCCLLLLFAPLCGRSQVVRTPLE